MLKIGDQVILNSGGPVMTIERVDGDLVTCNWDAGKRSAVFRSKTLTLAG